MPSSVFIILDQRREKKDNTFPISYRIVLNRYSTTINSGYSVNEKHWDAEKLHIRAACKKYKHISFVNNQIKQRESEISKKLIELDTKGELLKLSIRDLRNYLIQKNTIKKLTFCQYADMLIEKMKDEKRFGNARSYKDAKNFILNYNDKKDVTFIRVTPSFLNKMEVRFMAKENNHYNGLAAYMRGIRAIYNHAVVEGHAEKDQYPFRQSVHDTKKYRIRTEKTSKRAVKKSFFSAIEGYDSKEKTPRFTKARYIFLFSFYMRGMNFTDIAWLNKSQVKGEYLLFKRKKTGGTFRIKINPKAMDILIHFGLKNKKPGQFLFPIIKRPYDVELANKDIKNSLKTINKTIKEIAEELNFSADKLTTYVARHSWATILDKAGIDRRTISQGLGHSDLATTNIYIDDIVSDDQLEEADKIITG